MNETLYTAQVKTEDIDALIMELHPILADKETSLVMTSLIAILVMGTHPDLEGEQLVKTIEQFSQMLAILQPEGTESKITLN